MSDTGSNMSSTELKRRLQSMGNEDFEYFVADLWERQGWQTSVSQKSRDKSLDVMAEKADPYDQRHAIQAKRYKEGNRVGGPKISEYASLRDYFDADASVVVTTSGYTSDARERAESLNVKLVDGDDLVQLVEQLGAYDLVEKYSPTPASSEDQEIDQTHEVEVPDSGGSTSGFGLTSIPGISLERNWAKFIAYSAVVSFLAFLVVGATPTEPTNAILAAIQNGAGLVWIGTTCAIFFGLYVDIQDIQRSTIPWQPKSKRWFIGVFFTWYFGLLYYFYNRRKAMGATDD